MQYGAVILRYNTTISPEKQQSFFKRLTQAAVPSASGTTSFFNVNLSPDAIAENQVWVFSMVSAQQRENLERSPELAPYVGISANSVAVCFYFFSGFSSSLPREPCCMNCPWICFFVCWMCSQCFIALKWHSRLEHTVLSLCVGSVYCHWTGG